MHHSLLIRGHDNISRDDGDRPGGGPFFSDRTDVVSDRHEKCRSTFLTAIWTRFMLISIQGP